MAVRLPGIKVTLFDRQLEICYESKTGRGSRDYKTDGDGYPWATALIGCSFGYHFTALRRFNKNKRWLKATLDLDLGKQISLSQRYHRHRHMRSCKSERVQSTDCDDQQGTFAPNDCTSSRAIPLV